MVAVYGRARHLRRVARPGRAEHDVRVVSECTGSDVGGQAHPFTGQKPSQGQRRWLENQWQARNPNFFGSGGMGWAFFSAY